MIPDHTSSIARRRVLGGMAAAGAASLIGAPAWAADKASPRFDPDSLADQSLAFRKLAFSLDGTIGFWWLRGTRYGLLDAVLTPFWEMHLGKFFTVRDLDGGNYEVTTVSTAFYTDLKTGAFIKTFLNPFTDKTITIGYFAPKPSKVIFGADGMHPAASGPLASLKSTGTLGETLVEGDRIVLRADHILSGAVSGYKGTVEVNDLTTYFGSLRDVLNPRIKSAPAAQTFSDINTWPAWLEMGDHPGNYYSRVYGEKVFTYNAMPKFWRDMMAQEYPDIAKDPAAALRG
jgi:hypothetical protein